MGRIFRIGGALVLGTVMVGGAFLSSRADDGVSNAAAQVVVTEVPKIAQEVRDSDGDGRRDWEEELRGTDPFTPDDWDAILEAPTVSSAQVDDYVPPTTLTGQFAKSFFEDYVRTSGGETFEAAAQEAFIHNETSALVQSVTPHLFTRADINIGTENDMASVRDYGNLAGHVIVYSTVQGELPLTMLHQALEKNDPSLLSNLPVYKESYSKMRDGLIGLVVPPALIDQHLDLINMYSALAHDIDAFENAFDDPLRALVSARQYTNNLESMLVALNNMRLALERFGIVYQNDETGNFFFSLRP